MKLLYIFCEFQFLILVYSYFADLTSSDLAIFEQILCLIPVASSHCSIKQAVLIRPMSKVMFGT